MKNRIDKLFDNKQKDILSVYFTAGYPELNSTGKILTALEESGVDLVEIGIPFSDPIADGPVIQDTNNRALANGMNVSRLFDQLYELKDNCFIPKILMGYFNPILQYGIEKFFQLCMQTGISGVIIPDLPIDVYQNQYKSLFDQYNQYNILLVTPQTNQERLRFITELSQGFVYAVSTSSTTGITKDNYGNRTYLKSIKSITNKPVLAGFGIHDSKTFSQACSVVNGAIIGSAFLKYIKGKANLSLAIREFVQNIKIEKYDHSVSE